MDCGGDTAYVFIAMIVLSDENGIIKHTPESLARAICKDSMSVRDAILNLEKPDARSNLKAHEGRRIVPLSEVNEDETRGWLVVNKNHYRDKKDLDVIRAQTRERVRKFRGGNAEKRDVTLGNAEKRHTDTDTDTRTTLDDKSSRSDFEKLWKTYPKRAGNNPKRKAESAYKARLLEKHTPVAMLDGASRYAKFVRSTGKEGTEFVLQTATFLGKDTPFMQPWAAPNGQGSWDRTESATLAKGVELGLPARPGESMEEYRGRIRTRLAS